MIAINRDLALEIAEKHLNEMNPDMWGGEGDAPSNFDERICTYEIGSDYAELYVSFYYDKNEQMWCHYCELRDKDTEEDLLRPISGYGVDSPINLADSIMDACN